MVFTSIIFWLLIIGLAVYGAFMIKREGNAASRRILAVKLVPTIYLTAQAVAGIIGYIEMWARGYWYSDYYSEIISNAVLIVAAVCSVMFVLNKNFIKQIEDIDSNGRTPAQCNKTTATLFAFLLGFAGVHSYYMGYKKKGIIQSAGAACFVIGLIFRVIGTLQYNYYMNGWTTFSALLLIYAAVIDIWAIIDGVMILLDALYPAATNKWCAAPVQRPQPAPSDNEQALVESLNNLKIMYDNGLLTEDEYAKKRKEIISKL